MCTFHLLQPLENTSALSFDLPRASIPINNIGLCSVFICACVCVCLPARAHLHICIPSHLCFPLAFSASMYTKDVQHWEKNWSTCRCQPLSSPFLLFLSLSSSSSPPPPLSCSSVLCCSCVLSTRAGTWLKARATSLLYCPAHSTAALTTLLWRGAFCCQPVTSAGALQQKAGASQPAKLAPLR